MNLDIDLLMEVANGRPALDKTPEESRLDWVEQRIDWIVARLRWIDNFEKQAVLKGIKRDRDAKLSRAA